MIMIMTMLSIKGASTFPHMEKLEELVLDNCDIRSVAEVLELLWFTDMLIHCLQHHDHDDQVWLSSGHLQPAHLLVFSLTGAKPSQSLVSCLPHTLSTGNMSIQNGIADMQRLLIMIKEDMEI